MAKVTAKGLQLKVRDYLGLYGAIKRAEKLKAEIKAEMEQLGFSEVALDGLGRVVLSPSTRTTVPAGLVRQVLGRKLGRKVITESVSNDVIKAPVTLGEISEEQRQQLLAGAEQTPATSLKVYL